MADFQENSSLGSREADTADESELQETGEDGVPTGQPEGTEAPVEEDAELRVGLVQCGTPHSWEQIAQQVQAARDKCDVVVLPELLSGYMQFLDSEKPLQEVSPPPRNYDILDAPVSQTCSLLYISSLADLFVKIGLANFRARYLPDEGASAEYWFMVVFWGGRSGE